MKKYLIGSSSNLSSVEEEKKTSSDEQFVQRKVKKMKHEIAHRGELSVINAHPRDTRIEFVEDGHYYKNEHGGRFRISVSQLKSHFFPAFNKEESIAMKFQYPQRDAKGDLILKNGRQIVGVSPSARVNPPDFGLTRRECIEKQNATSVFGTMVHAKIQKYLELQLDPAIPLARRLSLFLGKTAFTTEEGNIAKQVVETELDWISKGWTIFRVEWAVFDEDFDVAGQIDAVLKRINGTATEYAVVDWKTTKYRMSQTFSKQHFAFYPFHEYTPSLGNQYLFQETSYAFILTRKYGMNVTMIMAVGIHQDKPRAQVTIWTGGNIPFKEIGMAFEIEKNFMDMESMIKRWEEDGLTANGLFPTLPEPPFFKKIQDD